MPKHILVTYGTRAESTHEVAEFISEVLRFHGMTVDIRPVKAVKDLVPYDAVVLGSAIRIGNVLSEVLRFARRYKTELEQIPVAYFVVCATMKEDTPANREVVNTYLEPLRDIKEPIAQGMFAGRVQYDIVEFPWRYLLRLARDEELLAEGDFREWVTIRAWARDLSHELLELAQV